MVTVSSWNSPLTTVSVDSAHEVSLRSRTRSGIHCHLWTVLGFHQGEIIRGRSDHSNRFRNHLFVLSLP